MKSKQYIKELHCRARDNLVQAEVRRFSPAPLNLLAKMPTRVKIFRRLIL